MSDCVKTPKVEVTSGLHNVTVTEKLVLIPEMGHQAQSNCPINSEVCSLQTSEIIPSFSESNLPQKNQNEKSSPYLDQNTTGTEISISRIPITCDLKKEDATNKQALQMENYTSKMSPQAEMLLLRSNAGVSKHETLPQKEKTKGVSFLSRLANKGGKKKELTDDPNIVRNDTLIDGISVNGLKSSVNASGFAPQKKEPRSYIRVRSRKKKEKVFDHLFLAQELSRGNSSKKENTSDSPLTESGPENDKSHLAVSKSGNAIWAMEFSLDGRYLATAGCDHIVRVWVVLSNPDDRRTFEHEEKLSLRVTDYDYLSAPVFKSKPLREYLGHNGDVLEVNWSKNNFLLTSSLDKMIKLWHPSRQECLTTFCQKELITSITFHPTDDRFFLSGSLDCILRLWSIPEKDIVFSCETPDPITAVAFTPNGSIAIAGSSSGLCNLYDIDQENGLKFRNQIHVRSSRGKNSKGSKITGIKTLFLPPDDQDTGDVSILVSSNDSRIRLYKLKDSQLEMKFQGHQNTHSQIKASFSCDGRYIICGSENRKTYMWGAKSKDSDPKEPTLMEMFTAHNSIVTTAIFAPAATRRLLSESEDPIYDICNPPPVTLLSLEERFAESLESNGNPSSASMSKKAKVSPTYLSRTSHDDGPIILTSDMNGSIKCFRIDCAFEKRHHFDAGSVFSKKGSSIRRSDSFMTRTSTSSRQDSLEQSSSLRSIYRQNVLNWRGKVSNEPMQNSQREESITPEIVFAKTDQHSLSFTPQINVEDTLDKLTQTASLKGKSISASKSVCNLARSANFPPTPGFSLTNSNKSDELTQRFSQIGKSGSFWNRSNWQSSLSSRTSRDTDSKGLEAEYLTARNIHNEEDLIKIPTVEASQSDISGFESDQHCCEMCDGKDFRARKVSGKGLVMVCIRCGVIIG